MPDAFGGEPAAAGLSVSLVDDDPATLQVHLGGVPVLARGLGVRLPRQTWVRYRVNCSAARLSVRVGERWVLRDQSLPGWAAASSTVDASR